MAQVFSCEFCEIFKNTFFTEHLRATAPDFRDSNFIRKNAFFYRQIMNILHCSKTNGEIYFITSEEISSYPQLFFVFKVLRASFHCSSVTGLCSKDG